MKQASSFVRIQLAQVLSQRLSWNVWVGLTWLLVGFILIPIGFVLSSIFADTGEIWSHLATTVLPRYLLNSLLLVVGVGLGVSLIGTGTAWLVTMCQFPGRQWVEWALLLPLAAPAYVLAYTYTTFLDFSGPVQTTLRQIFGWEGGQYWFPSIRSVPGAIAMLVLVLYPYVYLVTRLAFLEQSARTLEASRSLGCGPWRTFATVAIPLARPSIMAGIALALMETLNDYGTVQYFGVQTFTTGIFRTWYGMGERVAATQLAAILLLLTLGLILLERWSRRRSRYYQLGHPTAVNRFQLQGIHVIGAWLMCWLPLTLGFLLPGGLLIQMSLDNIDLLRESQFWQYARNSFVLACLTAVIAVIISLILAYTRRIYSSWSLTSAIQIASIGYAIPGSVIAVGVLIPIGFWDSTFNTWLSTHLALESRWILSGSMTAVIFAYLVRFLAVSFSTVEANLLKIRPHLDEAARSLGYHSTAIFFKIHVPLLWKGVLTALLLVFVDVMKELPATIVIRPFNFDTLAVRAYQLASDERLAEAAAPALSIVLVGILPVALLSWQISRSRN